jgi:long-chain acyl-CoA synthetase
MGGLPKRIVVVEGALPDPDRDLRFAELIEQGRAADGAEAELRAASASADDLATIIYTSGTTGEPKGVMLAHDNFVNQFEHLDEHFTVEPSDRSLCFLPLSHVYERAWSFYVLFKGAANSYVTNPREVADYLAEVKPTVMVAVPRLYEKVHSMVHSKVEDAPPLRRRLFHWAVRTGSEYQYAIRGEGAGRGLKFRHFFADRLVLSKIRKAMGGKKNVLSAGGAPLARNVEEFFLAAGMLICQGYGLTETAPMLTCNKPHEFRFGTVGKPIRGVEIGIDENGEILARGPNVMRGYFRNEEATAEAIVDGWFRTGDIGHYDDEGFLVITDRIKDIIVTSGGKNVAPQRIELVVGQDPYVEQLAVVGDRRKFLGALVVPSFEALADWAGRQRLRFKDHGDLIKLPEVISFMDERVRERCGQLAPFERIKRVTLLPRPFSMEKGEMTPTLKVRRKAIADAYHDLIDRMFM